MPQANLLQTNFTSGEVSPSLLGRVDIQKYFNGARKLLNLIVKPQGGARRRPGSEYLGEVEDSSKTTRLVSFKFSDIQSYVLEFGDLKMRIWKDGAIVGGGTPVEVTTPWAHTELAEIWWTQSADVLYVSHPDYQTRKISRTSDTVWTVSLLETEDGPYGALDDSGNHIKVELVSDITTLIGDFSSDTILIATSGSPFVVGDEEDWVEYIEYTDAYSFKHYALRKIPLGGYNSATSVDVDTKEDTIHAESFLSIFPNTVTESGGTLTSTLGIFDPGSVGKYVRLTGSQSWWLITGYTSATRVTATSVAIVTYTYPTVTLALNSGFVSGDVGKYIDYPLGEEHFGLAEILTVESFSELTVKVLDPLILPDRLTFITGATTSIVSSTSIFSSKDLGKFIRNTDGQVWREVTTAPTAPSAATGTELTLKTYTYPDITMELRDDRVITVTLRSKEALFAPSHVDRSIRLQFGSEWREATVTAYTSPTEVRATLNQYIPWDETDANALYGGGKADGFRMNAWNDDDGWPAIVGFHEQRLTFGRTASDPVTVWTSRSGDFEYFAPTDSDSVVPDDAALTLVLASNQADPLTWFTSDDVLLIGTEGSEFKLEASSLKEPLTPTNLNARRQAMYGSRKNVRPVQVGVTALYVQRSGRKLRGLSYDYQVDKFVSSDMTIMSEHILKAKVKEIAFQSEPDGILWCVLDDGTLASLTYEKDQEVVAWTRHELGGVDTVVESVATIPAASGDRDEVYFVVSRTIDGGTVRYVEKLAAEYDADEDDTEDMRFLDSYLYDYQASPSDTLSGLGHLEGETAVYVHTENGTEGPYTVTSGAIVGDLAAAVSHRTAGLLKDAELQTLTWEGGAEQGGTSQAKMKRVHDMGFRVVGTNSFYYKTTRNTDWLSKTVEEDVGRLSPEGHFALADGFDMKSSGGEEFNVSLLAPEVKVSA